MRENALILCSILIIIVQIVVCPKLHEEIRICIIYWWERPKVGAQSNIFTQPILEIDI